MAMREPAASLGGSAPSWRLTADDTAAHALELPALITRLASAVTGLSESEAGRRLEQCGPNRLAAGKPVSAMRVLVAQFRGVVVGLLATAAIIAIVLGDRLEAVAIVAVLLINASLGFVTEWRARRAIATLVDLETAQALVVRDGRLRSVDAAVLVPGDVIEVNAGQRVPADARVIEAHELRLDEAVLTGESFAVAKRPGTLEQVVPLAERSNRLLKGTVVATGTGRALVTTTGAATELGRVGTLVSSLPDEQTPLERRLDALGQRLVWVTLVVAAAIALLGWLQGTPLTLVLQTGVALAVAAVPEALPAVVTIALAVGLRRMAVRHALVRRLPAVETLGSTTIVCTDKTRTLTSGEMSVVHVWTADAEVSWSGGDEAVAPPAVAIALRIAALASRSQPHGSDRDTALVRDPVDAAMIHAAWRHAARWPSDSGAMV